ncbi:MAG: helix-turn-helix transcriptional regulator [Planctomycetes bacterium]|nr:helix-turn-helix transcriptional regulator [Planctomycetota bacterium]
MDPVRLAWPLPLGEAPLIHNLGIGVHDPRESGRYRLTDLWCLHFYGWRGAITLGGVTLPIEPGSVGLIPPGLEHQYTYHGRSVHAYAHFRVAASAAEAIAIPAMQQLGERFAPLRAAMVEALGWFAQAPRRAEARLWEVLWQIASTAADERTPAALVERAQRMIEVELSERLSVASLARRLGCSHNHLTRLFRQELGMTVVAYIRRRRVERARRLLEYTIIPIRAVAAEVGIPNLQRFNKTVRLELGRAPRTLRRSHG